jgi:hypothetical protein
MATTEELISILEKQYVGWARDGVRGIRTYLDIAQDILCNVEGEQLMIFDSSTGELPTFDTTDGVREYSLPSNVNFIDAVCVEADARSTLIDNIRKQDYGRITRTHRRPIEQFDIAGIRYILIPYIRSYQRTETSVAKVLFTEPVETSTDVYRYRGYKKATAITSDSIPLTVFPPYDIQLLLPATAKLMDGIQNGNYVEAYKYVGKHIAPQMHKAFNRGAQGIFYEAEDQGF